MWYAVYVETGKESVTKDYCSKLVNNVMYNDIFVLRFNKVKKFYGKWHKESKVMFPGYINSEKSVDVLCMQLYNI